MKTRTPALLALAALAAVPAPFAAAQDKGQEQEQRSTLTRVREGGTPYDPNQRLTPYKIDLAGPAGVTLRSRPDSALVTSPPEYAPCRGVMFQYGNSWNSVVTACVSALTAGSVNDEIAWVVVANQTTANSAASAFAAAGANLSKVVFIVAPVDSIWLRDYGPHFIFENGTLAVVDSHYYANRPNDNFIPTIAGDGTFGVPTYDQPLYYSGGNFQAGPNRTGFCTALVNLDNPSSAGFNETLVRDIHRSFQGIDTLYVLPQLPFSVDGTGHIDMWMYLVDENTVIISEFIAGSNATAISVTNNAVPYMQALGFEVFRPQAWNAGGAHFTYTNAFRVNNRIFVPVYGTGIVAGGNSAYNARDTDAIAKWTAAAGPGVTLVPIQCSSIIGAAGAIHCIVKQVPRYANALPAAHVAMPESGAIVLAGTQQEIRWNATDTNNVALANVDLAYSTDGVAWTTIASAIPDTGSYSWSVPAGLRSGAARVRVTARATDGDTVIAVGNPFRVAPGTRTRYDFASGAGVDRFATGSQTTSWTTASASSLPVTTALTSAQYAALATSNASGGDTDANRYISPAIASGSEATHVFRVRVAEDPASVDELRITWEGYADNCTQAELYVWDVVQSQWGDAAGLIGQNRFADSWAGNRDEAMTAAIRSNIGNFVASDGTVRFMVYAERPADETFHDFVAVDVTTLDPAPSCPSDFDASGSVDGADLGQLLAAWGPCAECAFDLNGDGIVDGADLGEMLAAWGACP
jgi:agmatine/peptidylarginine deiminase